MKKFASQVFFGFATVIQFFVTLALCLIIDPVKRFIAYVREDNKIMLVFMPQFLRRHLRVFDYKGYRHSQKYLNSLILSQVAAWSYDEQAELAHLSVTKHLDCCIRIPRPMWRLPLDLPPVTMEVSSNEAVYMLQPEENFNHRLSKGSIDVTEVGNLAYITLHHKDEEVRKHAFNLLFNLKKHFNVDQNEG